MATTVAFAWNFGDGATSTEQNPLHTYMMAGVYTWRLQITDSEGVVLNTSGVVTVYEWDYTDASDTNHVAYTNICYRSAVKRLQGVGIVPWAGDQWLYPTAYYGTGRGYNTSGNPLSLVMHNANGRFYQIGIPELWTERTTDQYGGGEISCKFKLKEHRGVAGEYEEIEHIESHVHMRPFWETNRDLTGYQSNGFRDDYSLDVQMYENGEPVTPAAKLQNVPRYGDYVYRRREEARRLQMEILTNTSGWRCVKVQQLLMSIDKKSGPAFDFPQETQWQQEYSTPDFWVSRDTFKPIRNRATAANCGGAYDGLVAGPDGNSRSAMAFGAAGGLTETVSFLAGSWTLLTWVSDVAAFPVTLWSMDTGAGGTATVRLTQLGAVVSVEFNDGVNADVRTLDWDTTGWVLIGVNIDKANSMVRILENGVQLSSTPLIDNAQTYGGSLVWCENSIMAAFDGRRLPRGVSAGAQAWYYDDVVNYGGNSGLLPINR